MERQKRRALISVILADALFVGGCSLFAKNPQTLEATGTHSPNPLATPTLITPTHAVESPTAAVATITNKLTGAVFAVTSNPEKKTGKCVKLGQYSASNKQTVNGAATALGPDSGKFNDYPKFIVYKPDLSVLGSFTTEALAPAVPFGSVLPGTVVCED